MSACKTAGRGIDQAIVPDLDNVSNDLPGRSGHNSSRRSRIVDLDEQRIKGPFR